MEAIIDAITDLCGTPAVHTLVLGLYTVVIVKVLK